MATQTTNYGLKKPAYSDTADIGVINSNMDIIDAKMKEIDDKAGSGGGGGTSVTVDSELSTTSENPVQNKVITQALNEKGTYSKPTGGIPKTDLASEVQTSLGKADTALQEHQDISGKADKAEVTALYNSISDAWDSATAYTVGQYCIYNNALWKCLVANTNIEPAEGTHWTKVSVANEIASVNSSLEWNEIDVNITPPNVSPSATVATIKELIGKSEVIFQSGSIQINIRNKNENGESGSFYFMPGANLDPTDYGYAKYILISVNFSTGEIKARQYKGSAASTSTFTKLFYR